jgi:hypothetical protein
MNLHASCAAQVICVLVTGGEVIGADALPLGPRRRVSSGRGEALVGEGLGLRPYAGVHHPDIDVLLERQPLG